MVFVPCAQPSLRIRITECFFGMYSPCGRPLYFWMNGIDCLMNLPPSYFCMRRFFLSTLVTCDDLHEGETECLNTFLVFSYCTYGIQSFLYTCDLTTCTLDKLPLHLWSGGHLHQTCRKKKRAAKLGGVIPAVAKMVPGDDLLQIHFEGTNFNHSKFIQRAAKLRPRHRLHI